MDKYYDKDFKAIVNCARVFLNCFNLILDDETNGLEKSVFPIFDQNKKVVGHLGISAHYYHHHAAYINATIKDIELHASYEIPVLYFKGQISANIDYVFKLNNKDLFFGSFYINGTYNGNCYCKTNLGTQNDEMGNCILQLRTADTAKLHTKLRTEYIASMYQYSIIKEDGNYVEQMFCGYPASRYSKYTIMYHDIKKAILTRRLWRKIYYLYYDQNNNEFYKYLVEGRLPDEYIGNVIENREYQTVPASIVDNIEITKGDIMQYFDPDMFAKIQQFQKILTTDSCAIFDNLVRVCIGESFGKSTEELKAIFGTDIAEIKFQNNAKNLKEAFCTVDNPVRKLKKF